jgi:hypothetical protein
MQAALTLVLALSWVHLSVEVPGWPLVAAPADVVSVNVPTEAGGGARLRARLHVPTLLRGEPTAPAALMLHGVPSVDTCEDFAVSLRDAGIHCLVLQYRGCGGSDGVFSFASLSADVSAALDWLARCAPLRAPRELKSLPGYFGWGRRSNVHIPAQVSVCGQEQGGHHWPRSWRYCRPIHGS